MGVESQDFFMTSITAYLTALAHSSCKQRVLKANIQASTGDTDVCRKRSAVCRCLAGVGQRRVNTLLLQTSMTYLNSCDAGLDLMSLAGMFGENTQGSQQGSKNHGNVISSFVALLSFYPFYPYINTDTSFLLLCLSTTRPSVRHQGVFPLRCPPVLLPARAHRGHITYPLCCGTFVSLHKRAALKTQNRVGVMRNVG